MTTSQRVIHAWVSGIVQGVNYRQSTRAFAEPRGITGWVKNLSDGRVEVMAAGTPDAIMDLIAWLHYGPALAQVTDVQVEDAPHENFPDFRVLK